MFTRCLIPVCVVLSWLTVIRSARARNVDLSTVPNRDSVQLTIYNSEDLTLVRETRKISFKKGANSLQFSWANTLIDPTSVELRFLTDPHQLDLLDTTFPHDKPHMLYWNVQSDLDGEAVVEISYFTSGIRWTADYVGIANADETDMRFDGYVRVANNSGEEYENAQIRLVVGTINLVQKIAELAQIPVDKLATLDESQRQVLRGKAVKRLVEDAEAGAGPASQPGAGAQPKQIVKEGLSEYFLYTIEGTETIDNGWSKRMRSFHGKTVPFAVKYRYREPEYGKQLVRMYLLVNDNESQLGTTPLPDGIVRVFRDNGRDGLSFMAAQHIKYVPIGDRIELNLGPDPQVVFELVKLRVWRTGIWMQLHGASVFRKLDDNRLKVEINSQVAGWQEHTLFTQRIRNYSGKKIDVEVRRRFLGHIVFRSALNATNHDYQTVQYAATVEPGESRDLLYETVSFQGHGKQHDNVTIERTKVGL